MKCGKGKAVISVVMATAMGVCAVTGNGMSSYAMSEYDKTKVESIREPETDYKMETNSFSYLYFGNYPQSEVTGVALTEAIEKGDYASSGIASDYTDMEGIVNYAVSGEAVVQGDRYRRMAGEDGSYRYFKYEPIKWRVISVKDQVAEIMTELVLDTKIVRKEKNMIADTWMSGEVTEAENFLECAFTKDEIRSIQYEKVTRWEYKSKICRGGLLAKASDYAWCNGIMQGDRSDEYVDWWIDANGAVPAFCGYISRTGEVCREKSYESWDKEHYMYDADKKGVGIRPVVLLDLTKTECWDTLEEMEKEHEATSYEITDIRNYREGMQVLCEVPEECILVVEGYNERGELEASGETVLKKGTTSAYVSVKGFKDKGTYLMKATLVDMKTGTPVSQTYTRKLDDIGYRKVGTCGEQVYYTWGYDGHVDIYGTGAMYDYKMSLLWAPAGKDEKSSEFSHHSGLTSVTVHDGVTYVGDAMFLKDTSLKKIELAPSVSAIGAYAFYGGTSVEEVQLGSGIKKIGNHAFEKCTMLKNIDIPDGVESLGASTFAECTSLEKMILPDSVTEVGANAFGECAALKEVRVSKNMKKIPNSMFYRCISLRTIAVPEGVREISSDTFLACRGLEKLVLPNSLQVVDGEGLDLSEETLVCVRKGSYAEQYLCSIGRSYVYVDEEGNQIGEVITPPKPTPTPSPTPTPAPSKKPIVSSGIGDVDRDGYVTLWDVKLILNAALKIAEFREDEQKSLADLDSDGVISVQDAKLALRRALKIDQ